MALGLTQHLTEMSTKGRWCIGLTTSPPSCADYLEILEASTTWSPNGLASPEKG